MANDREAVWKDIKSGESAGPARWLKWRPSQIDDCVRARGEVLPATLGAEELDELRQAHSIWGAGPATMAAIDRLGQPSARVVITGQQPGLLAGPLYTLYKAAGAIRLARDLAGRHPGLDFVPVFWVASEDDDLNEVRRAYWPGAHGELEETLLDNRDWVPGKMIGMLTSAPVGAILRQRVTDSTFKTEFRRAVLEMIEQAYGSSLNWEETFCKLLFKLLPDSGLVIVSPLMKWIRRRGAEILRRELTSGGRTNQLLSARADEMEAAGVEPAIRRKDGQLNLFWLDENRLRHPLVHENGAEGGSYIRALSPTREPVDPTKKRNLPGATPEDFIRALERDPGDFTFNAVTRAMVQDTALPTVAQVVGPGEAQYLAQVEPLYAEFGADAGVFVPVRWPRPQATLIPNNVERLLARYNLNIEDVWGQEAFDLARRVIERDLSQGALQEINDLEARQIEELAAMQKRLGSHPSLVGAVDRMVRGMKRGFETIRDRVLYLRQEDERSLSEAMNKIENGLNPRGKPQERMLNPIVPFMIHYGPDWAARMVEKLNYAPDAKPQLIPLQQFAVSSPPPPATEPEAAPAGESI